MMTDHLTVINSVISLHVLTTLHPADSFSFQELLHHFIKCFFCITFFNSMQLTFTVWINALCSSADIMLCCLIVNASIFITLSSGGFTVGGVCIDIIGFTHSRFFWLGFWFTLRLRQYSTGLIDNSAQGFKWF